MAHTLDRGMPASIDAEKAILGAIFIDERQPNECLLQAINRIKVEDFSLDSHRRIYRAMLAVAEAEKPIDFVTVTEHLGEKKEIEAVGGVVYVTCLTDGLPRYKNIESYCDILVKASAQRQIIHAAQRAVAEAYEQGDPGEITGKLQAEVDSITTREQGKNCVHVSQIGPPLCRQLIADFNERGSTIGLPSGIGRLDCALGGLVRGENICIAGYTGAGKTAFALNVVEKNCPNDVPVTFYSFEVDKETLLIRLACKRLGIPQIKIRNKTISYDDTLRIIAEIQEIQRWPFWIDDRSFLTPRELYASARMQAAKGARLFVTDHLHLFAANCKGHSIREQCNEASATIRAMGKDSRVPVLNLCQLSRPEDKRTPRKPVLYDLKESGNIENDSHSVVMLWCEMTENQDGHLEKTGRDAILLRKNRSGPLIEIAAKFNGELMYWEEESPYVPPTSSYQAYQRSMQ